MEGISARRDPNEIMLTLKRESERKFHLKFLFAFNLIFSNVRVKSVLQVPDGNLTLIYALSQLQIHVACQNHWNLKQCSASCDVFGFSLKVAFDFHFEYVTKVKFVMADDCTEGSIQPLDGSNASHYSYSLWDVWSKMSFCAIQINYILNGRQQPMY